MRSHVHRDAVVLPDGTTVLGASFEDDRYERIDAPDFGLYFDASWSPPWQHVHCRWIDFGVPNDVSMLHAALDDALVRAQRGERVEIGCLGGHGRTGTALACLAVLAGLAEDPVAWIRRVYCPRAVETEAQADLARTFGSRNRN